MNENTYIMTKNGELYHYGVKGMKWGVRKAEYKSMSRSQKRDVKRKYKQNRIDQKAEKRVDKYGISVANAISRGKGAVKTALTGSLGTTSLFAASKLYATTNVLGGMSAATIGSHAATLATYATMTGIATIPVAALGAYGLYRAGKSIANTGKETSANERANINRS